MSPTIQPSAIDDSFEFVPIRSRRAPPHDVQYQHWVEPGDTRSAIDNRDLTEHGFMFDRPLYDRQPENFHKSGNDFLRGLAKAAIDSKRGAATPEPAKHEELNQSPAQATKRHSHSRRIRGIIIKGKDGQVDVRRNPWLIAGDVNKVSPPLLDPPAAALKKVEKVPSRVSSSGKQKIRIVARDGREKFYDMSVPLRYGKDTSVTPTRVPRQETVIQEAESQRSLKDKAKSKAACGADKPSSEKPKLEKAEVKKTTKQFSERAEESKIPLAQLNKKEKRAAAKAQKRAQKDPKPEVKPADEVSPNDSISVRMSGANSATKSSSQKGSNHDSAIGFGGGSGRSSNKGSKPTSKASSNTTRDKPGTNQAPVNTGWKTPSKAPSKSVSAVESLWGKQPSPADSDNSKVSQDLTPFLLAGDTGKQTWEPASTGASHVSRKSSISFSPVDNWDRPPSNPSSAKASLPINKPVTVTLGIWAPIFQASDNDAPKTSQRVSDHPAIEMWEQDSDKPVSRVDTNAWNHVYQEAASPVVEQCLGGTSVTNTVHGGAKVSSSVEGRCLSTETESKTGVRTPSGKHSFLKRWTQVQGQWIPPPPHGDSVNTQDPERQWIPPPPPPEPASTHEAELQVLTCAPQIRRQVPLRPGEFQHEKAASFATNSQAKSSVRASAVAQEESFPRSYLSQQSLASKSKPESEVEAVSQAVHLTSAHIVSQSSRRSSLWDYEIEIHRPGAATSSEVEQPMDGRVSTALHEIALRTSAHPDYPQSAVNELYGAVTRPYQAVPPSQSQRKSSRMPSASWPRPTLSELIRGPVVIIPRSAERASPGHGQETQHTIYAKPGDITPHPLSAVESTYSTERLDHTRHPRVRTVYSMTTTDRDDKQPGYTSRQSRMVGFDPDNLPLINICRSGLSTSHRNAVENTTFARPGVISPHPLSPVRSDLSFRSPPQTEPAWGVDDIPRFSDVHSSHHSRMASHDPSTVPSNAKVDAEFSASSQFSRHERWERGGLHSRSTYQPPAVESVAPTPAAWQQEPNSYPFNLDGARSNASTPSRRSASHVHQTEGNRSSRQAPTRYIYDVIKEPIKPSPLVPGGSFPKYRDPHSTNTDQIQRQMRPRERTDSPTYW